MILPLATIAGTVMLVLNVVVLLSILVTLGGAGLTALGLAKRAQAIVPRELLVKLEAAPADAERLQRALQALAPLLERAQAAIAGLAISLARVRGQVAAVRGAFAHLRF